MGRVIGKCVFAAVIIATSYWANVLRLNLGPGDTLPVLRDDEWWGKGEERDQSDVIRTHRIQFSPEMIKDLHTSLDRYLKRKPTPPLENQGFQYGFNTDYLTKVISYWRNNYQWKDRENFLNQHPQYKTWIQGLDVHFIRVTPTSTDKKVIPLLLLHGWPGSVREFCDMIPLLTTPRQDADFVFDVVVPSLPGYGFSEGAARPGLGAAQVAVVMKNLMKRIGFDKFYVQGGDWGAVIAKYMGVHSNMCTVRTLKANLKWALGTLHHGFVLEDEQRHLMYPLLDKMSFLLQETGYLHLHATKPDTIGSALSDTPAGLAAYILEKFSTWTNPEWIKLSDGGLSQRYTLDSLLDNIMIYWVSESIGTSLRLYAETFNLAHASLRLDRFAIQVPTACSRFHRDLTWQSDNILRDSYVNLLQITDHPDGGHFGAWETPILLSADIWEAVAKFQQYELGIEPDTSEYVIFTPSPQPALEYSLR